MIKNVKVSNIFFIILAVSLMLTQFQVLPSSAELTFSTTKITIPNSDRFGWSVQRLDDGFAVGEPFAGSDDSGLVHIFDSNGTPLSTIENPGTVGDNFGYSMNALGNVLAVGAPGTNSNSGTVYIFDVITPDIPTQSIPNPSGATGERMGEDQMNFFDNDLLVGISKAENDFQPSAGIIYKFRTSDGSIITHYDNPNGINANDLFGRSITVDEPLIVTGAHGALDEEGEAYVFSDASTVSITNPNTLASKLDDRFGWSTETTSSAYVVSAPRAEVKILPGEQIAKQGVVYLHHKDSSIVDVFASPDGSDINSGQNIEDQFGYWVAESNNLILVGAPFDDVKGVDGTIYVNAGSAYLFENNVHVATFNNPDPANGDLFGYSVDILNGQLIFGAPGDENNAGAVYYAAVSNEFAARLDIEADPDPAIPGSPITFTYTITNIGTIDLESADADPNSLITIVDDSCINIEGPIGNIDDAILFVGNAWTFTCTKQAPDTSFTESVNEELTVITFTPDGINTRTMTCSDPEFQCNPLEVNIASGKLTMVISADPNPALSGQTVNVDFDILNTGTIDLFIDGTGGVVDNNANCMPTGEGLDIIELEPGLHTHFTCTVITASLPIDFDAIVSATDSAENPITATDQYTLDVIGITLEISAQPDPTHIGTLTMVTYTVTNTSNTPLDIDGTTGVVESAAGCTPFAQNGIATIQSGESIEFTCTVTGTDSPIDFEATAFALYGNVVIPSNLVTFTLNSISHTPTVVSPQSLTTPEDTPFSDSLEIIDPDNTTWIITHPSSTLGTLIINTNGTYTFTPNLDTNGFESITITISDEDNTVTVALDITVSPVNDAPVLDPIGPQSGDENILITFTVTAIDIDQPPQPLTFSLAGEPLGALIDPFTGLFSWMPTEAQGPGIYTFDIIVSDVNGDTDTETIIITINEINTAPISNAGTDQTVNENILVALAGSGTDSDLPLQPLTFLWTQTGGPTITLSNPNIPNPTFTAPSVLTNTILAFTLDVSDGITSSTDTVNVTVQDTSVQLYCGLPESAYSKVIHGTNGNDNLVGTNGNDLIIGNDGNDKIKGKDGNDCLIGGDGNDKIWGGKGNDTIAGNAGDDHLSGQDGNDTVTGNAGDDKIWGGKGNDILDGTEGKDQIHGQQGIDAITGGDGDDKIWGGQDNDTINAGDGNNRVSANQGNDIVISGDGNDWINAGIGNDVVNAGLGDDKIFGMSGNDNLFGETGIDIIHGGQGNDLLNGGPNNDQCNGGQGINTFVDCELQKPMKEENEEEEDEEEQEDNDNGNNNGKKKN